MPSRPNLQIFGVGVQGASPVVTAARRVNCYHDVQPQADRTKVAIYGLPGLVAFCDLGDTPVRGLFSHGPYIYAVHRDTLYRIRNDGVQENKGTLDTSEGYVYFDANNAGEIAFVDGTSGYVWDTVGETFAKITDGDFPAAPHYITTARGYGVVPYGTVGQWIIDAGDDFTAWDALDFSTADAHPDTLVAALWQSDVLMLLGTDSTEYWGYTGSADFPFARISGSAYGWGLDARGSLARLGTGAIGLMRYQEQVRVARIAGAEPVNVTPPNLANVLNGYSRTDDARGTVFTHNGHELYQITFPTAGATWVYDSATGVWSERISYGLTTHRGLVGVQHQKTTYWGDVASGQIWKQDDSTWTDGGDPIVMTLRSEHVFDRNRRFTIGAVEFDMETGKGTAGKGYRENLLTYSEDYTNGAWTPLALSATADSTTSADGLVVLDLLTEDGTTSQRYMTQTASGVPASTDFCGSAYFKAKERTWGKIILRRKDGTYSHNWFDLTNGVVSASNTADDSGIEAYGGGVYRCWAVVNSGTGGTTPTLLVGVADADAGLSYAGDGTSGIYAGGAQVNTGDRLLPYYKTTATALTFQEVTLSPGGQAYVGLRIARDKGRGFGAERRLKLGRVGETKARVRTTRLGQARDWVFELSISDPIPRVLTGETLSVG